MERRYQIYIIKCTKTGHMFAGLTSTDNTNMLQWLNRKCKSGEAYIKLAKSIKDNEYKNHVFQRTKYVFTNKDEGEQALRKIQLGLEGKGLLLNDSVINTDKYVCNGCGKNVREQYRQVHDEKYCTSSTNSFIESMIFDEIEP